MCTSPAVWQSAWMKENETLTECLDCGNIISACFVLFFCALVSFCRWNKKALDGCSLCSVLIWSKLMSLKAERALVCSPEEISWLWSPVFLGFVQLYKPNVTLHQLQTAPLERHTQHAIVTTLCDIAVSLEKNESSVTKGRLFRRQADHTCPISRCKLPG